ncbi:MAG TPA: hypothetical protein PLE48_13400 [Thiobacillus sp.]|uniref:hypothetical protein n=1 Tax=Acidovorax sp. TaxID=1872122 RepID=UPI00262702C3|nr:hypothetical protein [Acidovorax sp.]HQT19128.1 hypothetical protein [Acidovorax defluvii]HQT71402.1 hypothetical protein [Thiobacillus sp.]
MAKRRNSALDFIQSFNDTYDTVNKVGRDYERSKVANGKPEETYGFNQGEVAQVQAAVDSGQYDVGYDAERKGYTVAPKADPSQVGFVGQGVMTRFLGNEQPGTMTPAQIDRARAMAMADVEMRDDPIAGLRLRREISTQDREDKRFGWEEQAQPLRQRGLELAASAGERTERKGQAEDASDEIFKSSIKEYTGAPEQIESTARYLNQNSARISMGSPDANGFVRISVVAADGTAEFVKLTRQDQAQLYAAGRLLETNPAKALEIMGGVNKNLATAIAQENGLVDQFATNANDVAYKGGQLGVAQQNANTMEAYRRQIGPEAGARAAGGAGGAKGADALWNLAEQVAKKGHYSGNPERAYEGLKRGQVRGGVQEQATKLELKLRENMVPESDIQKQLSGFLLSNGLPPAAAITSLRSGKGPDGKPLTANDYAQWDQTFPAMPVEDILGSVPQPAAQTENTGLPARINSARPARAPITTLVQPRTAAEARAQINPPATPRLTDEELFIRGMGLNLPR